MADILANEFGSIDNLSGATKEKLEEIPSVGPKIADSIVAYFENPKNREIIEKLEKAGVSMSKGKQETGGGTLKGTEFVITGKLESMSRPEAEEKIKELGGVAKSDVTRKTDYLVVGADPGSKLERAREMGIKIINESEFFKLLNK
jgi:DNA ligase (NAD+)